MFDVINRTVESWGPLATVGQKTFDDLLNRPNARDEVKAFIKRQKKLKTYKVTFQKISNSDQVEIQAEDDYSVGTAARAYFMQNKDKIEFKEQPDSKWADSYPGYDNIRYVKVRT